MAWAVRRPSSLLVAAAASAALAAASLLFQSGVTYDPYAWLIWGRDLAHFHLVTLGTGTSWKPLPALVNALLAPLGNAQADAWLVVARAGGLFAAFMAFRLARRIAGPRWGWLAGVAAAATFVLAHDVVRRTAVGNVEALAAAFVLLGIERHLDGRRGQAFVLVIAAALVRPETWPFALVYGMWLWSARARPPRAAIAAVGLLVPLLWFGGDWVGSGSLSTGSDRALVPVKGSPGVTAHPALAVFGEAARMVPVPARGAIVLALVWALARWLRGRGHTSAGAPREEPLTPAFAALALAWTAIVAAMAQRGYPGLPRFLFPAMGLAAVVAGVGVARAAELVAALPAAVPRIGRRLAVPTAAVAVAAAFVALAVPDASRLPTDAAAIDTVADRDAGLAAAISRLGGADAVLDCGHPYTGWFAVTALAWDLGVQPNTVHDAPHGRRPVVFALARGNAGLRSPMPRRHVRVAGRVDGWNVVDRCPRPS